MESAQKGKCRVKGADTLLLSGSPRGCVGGKDSPDANNLRYAAAFQIVVNGGTVKPHGEDSLVVSEADSAVLYLCAQTDYEDQFPHYRSGIDPVPQALQRVQVAAEKGYEALYQAHLADYQALFDRVEIQVGQEEETSLPTISC